MVSRFCVRLTSKGWFLKIVQGPWNMIHLMPCRNPCRLYIHLAVHILLWSLKRSVKKWTWTGAAFSTNESAWGVLVMGSQSRVWNGPHPQCQRKYSINQAQDKDSSCQQNLLYFNHLEAISDWSKYESTMQPYYYTKQQLQIMSALNIRWCEPTHFLLDASTLASKEPIYGLVCPNQYLIMWGWVNSVCGNFAKVKLR
jgi:hypothetical protein